MKGVNIDLVDFKIEFGRTADGKIAASTPHAEIIGRATVREH